MDPNQPQATEEKPAEKGATPESWEAWMEGQDEQVKSLYSKHAEGLLNSVKATRSERDELRAELKKLAKEQAEGSEAKTKLDDMATRLERTERRAAFFEEAMKPDIQCRNPRAAFLIAEAANLFDKKGNPDWDAIHKETPELFGAPNANANAGAGTARPPAPKKSMNDFIRKAAGRA